MGDIDFVVDYLPLQLEVLNGEAVELFNVKPSKATKFLVKNHVIEDKAEDVAQFINSQKQLSKRLIGEYVGDPDSFNQQVAENLFNLYSFTNLSLDEGIRYLAKRVRLPGEAQKIDRIMERFAESFCIQNPLSSLNKDTAYILSFSIIMLNTDLHNPSIPKPKKITLPQFINNHRGIDNGKNIDPIILTDIYNKIKKEAITMNEVDMFESDNTTFIGPTKSGWLKKAIQGYMIRYLKRWFVLKDSCLYYFMKPNDKRPKCIIPLEGIIVTRINTREILLCNRQESKQLKVGKFYNHSFFSRGGAEYDTRTQIRLKATNEHECYDWYIRLRGETEPISAILKQSNPTNMNTTTTSNNLDGTVNTTETSPSPTFNTVTEAITTSLQQDMEYVEATRAQRAVSVSMTSPSHHENDPRVLSPMRHAGSMMRMSISTPFSKNKEKEKEKETTQPFPSALTKVQSEQSNHSGSFYGSFLHSPPTPKYNSMYSGHNKNTSKVDYTPSTPLSPIPIMISPTSSNNNIKVRTSKSYITSNFVDDNPMRHTIDLGAATPTSHLLTQIVRPHSPNRSRSNTPVGTPVHGTPQTQLKSLYMSPNVHSGKIRLSTNKKAIEELMTSSDVMSAGTIGGGGGGGGCMNDYLPSSSSYDTSSTKPSQKDNYSTISNASSKLNMNESSVNSEYMNSINQAESFIHMTNTTTTVATNTTTAATTSSLLYSGKDRNTTLSDKKYQQFSDKRTTTTTSPGQDMKYSSFVKPTILTSSDIIGKKSELSPKTSPGSRSKQQSIGRKSDDVNVIPWMLSDDDSNSSSSNSDASHSDEDDDSSEDGVHSSSNNSVTNHDIREIEEGVQLVGSNDDVLDLIHSSPRQQHISPHHHHPHTTTTTTTNTTISTTKPKNKNKNQNTTTSTNMPFPSYDSIHSGEIEECDSPIDHPNPIQRHTMTKQNTTRNFIHIHDSLHQNQFGNTGSSPDNHNIGDMIKTNINMNDRNQIIDIQNVTTTDIYIRKSLSNTSNQGYHSSKKSSPNKRKSTEKRSRKNKKMNPISNNDKMNPTTTTTTTTTTTMGDNDDNDNDDDVSEDESIVIEINNEYDIQGIDNHTTTTTTTTKNNSTTANAGNIHESTEGELLGISGNDLHMILNTDIIITTPNKTTNDTTITNHDINNTTNSIIQKTKTISTATTNKHETTHGKLNNEEDEDDEEKDEEEEEDMDENELHDHFDDPHTTTMTTTQYTNISHEFTYGTKTTNTTTTTTNSNNMGTMMTHHASMNQLPRRKARRSSDPHGLTHKTSSLMDMNPLKKTSSKLMVHTSSLLNIKPKPLKPSVKSINIERISLYLEGRAMLLQKTYNRHTHVNIQPIDPLTLLISAPIKEGWLLIRECTENYRYKNPYIWKLRYCILCEGFDKAGPILFYYTNHEMALKMQNEGIQTQIKYVRLRTVDFLCINRIEPYNPDSNNVNTPRSIKRSQDSMNLTPNTDKDKEFSQDQQTSSFSPNNDNKNETAQSHKAFSSFPSFPKSFPDFMHSSSSKKSKQSPNNLNTASDTENGAPKDIKKTESSEAENIMRTLDASFGKEKVAYFNHFHDNVLNNTYSLKNVHANVADNGDKESDKNITSEIHISDESKDNTGDNIKILGDDLSYVTIATDLPPPPLQQQSQSKSNSIRQLIPPSSSRELDDLSGISPADLDIQLSIRKHASFQNINNVTKSVSTPKRVVSNTPGITGGTEPKSVTSNLSVIQDEMKHNEYLSTPTHIISDTNNTMGSNHTSKYSSLDPKSSLYLTGDTLPSLTMDDYQKALYLTPNSSVTPPNHLSKLMIDSSPKDQNIKNIENSKNESQEGLELEEEDEFIMKDLLPHKSISTTTTSSSSIHHTKNIHVPSLTTTKDERISMALEKIVTLSNKMHEMNVQSTDSQDYIHTHNQLYTHIHPPNKDITRLENKYSFTQSTATSSYPSSPFDFTSSPFKSPQKQSEDQVWKRIDVPITTNTTTGIHSARDSTVNKMTSKTHNSPIMQRLRSAGNTGTNTHTGNNTTAGVPMQKRQSIWKQSDHSSHIIRTNYPVEDRSNYDETQQYLMADITVGEYHIRMKSKDKNRPYDIFLTHHNPNILYQWFTHIKEQSQDSATATTNIPVNNSSK